jgi:hypothetical protein
MNERLDIRDLLVAISRMPEDRRIRSRSVWYESQKEHWIGWLSEYRGPGAYGRKVVEGRDGKYAYNHLACPDMLLFLAKGSGVRSKLIREATRAAGEAGPTLMAKCRAVRRVIPWGVVLQALRVSGHLPERALLQLDRSE